jgi:hypothetical protein
VVTRFGQGIERRVEKLRKRARRKRVKAAARTRKLVRMFESMDRDNDGTVSSKELFFGCMRAGLNIGLEDIKLMVRRADNGRNNQGDQMRLYDFISMFDGVDTGPPELPTPGGWQRIERPMARVHAALHKEQFVAARNILEKVTTGCFSSNVPALEKVDARDKIYLCIVLSCHANGLHYCCR